MFSSKLEVSVVYLNYNGIDILKKVLPHIISLEDGVFKEIIVIDNNSNDSSFEFLEKLSQDFIPNKFVSNFKIIKNVKNIGTAGINSVINHFQGKNLLILNNDIELNKNTIKRLLDALKNDSSVMAASPTYINYFQRDLVESAGNWLSKSFYCGKRVIIGNIYSKLSDLNKEFIPFSGILLMRRELIEQLGYIFDKDFFLYGEDVDLGLRIWLQGKKIIYVPNSIVYHMHAVTSSKISSPKIIFLMEKNLLITFFKNMELKSIVFFCPYVFGMRFAAMFKDIITLKFRNLFARLNAIIWILINFTIIIKKRKIIQKTREIKDKYLFGLFTEKYLFSKKKH